MKIGMLTGGGDCPGLNAVIRAIVRKSLSYGWECVGIENGWKGLVDIYTRPLDMNAVSGILRKAALYLELQERIPINLKAVSRRSLKTQKNLGLTL